jgi:cytoskeleton protein RodZ
MNEQGHDPLAAASPPTLLSPGEQMRAARERAGWTTERLAGELCLPLNRLEALERDEHASFGGAVFVRGYLRRAAVLLGIPPQELIEAFESCCGGAKPAEILPGLAPGQPPRKGAPGWLGPFAGTAAVAVVIASTWWLLAPLDEGAPRARSSAPAPATLEFVAPEPTRPASSMEIASLPVQVETVAPLQAGDDAVAPEAAAELAESPEFGAPRAAPDVVAVAESILPPPGTVELRFEFSADCWLEVMDAEDRRLAYRLHQAGDVVRLRGTAPVSVFLGNAEGVLLTVDGEGVPLRPARRDGTARLTVGGGAG